MSAFYDYIDEVLGAAEDVTDIVCTARKCWFYDFVDDPIRLWDGQGNFIDADGNEWLGTMNAEGGNLHKTPSIQDGRDGSSAAYTFSLTIPSIPGEDILALYNEMKANQDKVYGRALTCYIVIFKEGEGLRPGLPISFYKELIMFSPQFAEQLSRNADGTIVKSYGVSIVAKDNNNGRSETPNRTYADTMQKRRAQELGVSLDRGAEYLAILANRTYQAP